MSATAAAEHTCHGAIFCGQPRAAAERECPACETANELALHGSAEPLDGPLDFAAEQARMDAEEQPRPLLEVLQEHADKMRHQRLLGELRETDRRIHAARAAEQGRSKARRLTTD